MRFFWISTICAGAFNARSAFRTVLAATLVAVLHSAFAASAVPFVAPKDRPVTPTEQPWPANSFVAIAYHDVEDGEADQRYLSVRTANLVAQFSWLRENGYQPVSVDQILVAQAGGAALPSRAVLLTFDDGYSSFYSRVLPLLKAAQWPAVLAPVGRWIDTPADQLVDFGGLMSPRERFLTWDQIREIAQSGLVEIGAHTDDLHYGVLANPEGSSQPAAATHQYNPVDHSYEEDAQFKKRLEHDVQSITRKLHQATGRAPRVWVWPYGAASGTALEIIQANGYRMAMTLQDGLGDGTALLNTPRILVSNDPDISRFANAVIAARAQAVVRAAHVDLDYVYDSDAEQQARNFDKLIQRIHDLRINTVFLQAFADPSGDGLVRSLYFPNRHLPVRADLFNRAAWQLRTRAGVAVYAWMPVLAFDLDSKRERVQGAMQTSGKRAATRTEYARLSPFDAAARVQITEIYEDLARNAAFDGLLFHDDAVLSDFEDASPAALKSYRANGLHGDLAELRADPERAAKWTQHKSRSLTNFTLDLARAVKAVRGPQIKTARNIFALPVLDPATENWFAQNFDEFLASYDWVVPMVMPLMEGVPDAQINGWLDRIVDAVAKRSGALNRTVFEIQAVDWRGKEATPISDARLTAWLRRLQIRGARNLAYYPDNFATDHPDVSSMRSAISNYWFPYP